MSALNVSEGFAPSVAITMDVLSGEIELAAARCIRLDKILGEFMDSLPSAERQVLTESLHGVDLLAQHLTGLASFARNVCFASPDGLAVPVEGALASLTLGALAERMAEGLGAPVVEAEQVDPGEVDLF
ncbi:hypothetical protein [Phenylobacterium sp.]|uniref:hypothetical protein n=1 Tax=Phenylobacterium sp. TaxID=1871053 RepID=UPI0025ECE501|nr:hypothetical protein [Phenylobacterium sp.]